MGSSVGFPSAPVASASPSQHGAELPEEPELPAPLPAAINNTSHCVPGSELYNTTSMDYITIWIYQNWFNLVFNGILQNHHKQSLIQL